MYQNYLKRPRMTPLILMMFTNLCLHANLIRASRMSKSDSVTHSGHVISNSAPDNMLAPISQMRLKQKRYLSSFFSKWVDFRINWIALIRTMFGRIVTNNGLLISFENINP